MQFFIEFALRDELRMLSIDRLKLNCHLNSCSYWDSKINLSKSSFIYFLCNFKLPIYYEMYKLILLNLGDSRNGNTYWRIIIVSAKAHWCFLMLSWRLHFNKSLYKMYQWKLWLLIYVVPFQFQKTHFNLKIKWLALGYRCSDIDKISPLGQLFLNFDSSIS